MNKEITCRMIDGKPVVEYKEEYVLKKGDVVVSVCIGIDEMPRCFMAVFDHFCKEGYISQACFSLIECDTQRLRVGSFEEFDGKTHFSKNTRKATPEESEVMHHILNENGYELKGDTVVKKRWIPKMGEEFYYIYNKCSRLVVDRGIREEYAMDKDYSCCFKTEKAAKFACGEFWDLLLTLPQE